MGRSSSLFAEDIETRKAELSAAIAGSSILVIGAAGAIGGAVVAELARYAPRLLHLVDISENGLVEIVRNLHGANASFAGTFRTYAIDIRHREFDGFLAAMPSYDYVLNFAALKHVRSERDPFTLARLLDTNVLSIWRLLNGLKTPERCRFFSVSSDKAVRPANLMGASKALMEQAMWLSSDRVAATSARFANVAFSAGSLLEGFCNRLARRQPIAAPNDVRRYFISHEEAAQLCLLACFGGDNRTVFVPDFAGPAMSRCFDEIAAMVLRWHGCEPVLCIDEAEARALAGGIAAGNPTGGQPWPCLFTPSDTDGEKDLEEFFTESETLDYARYSNIAVLSGQRTADPDSLVETLSRLTGIVQDGPFDTAVLRELVQRAVPDLRHVERGRDLDAKM